MEENGKMRSDLGSRGMDFSEIWLHRYDGAKNTRPYMPLPLEYFEEMQYLSNEEFGELVRIMMWYTISGEVIPTSGALCHYITRVIDRQKRYYVEWDKLNTARKNAGKKGAAARWGKSTEVSDSGTENEL